MCEAPAALRPPTSTTGWLVAWGLCVCMLIRSSTVWLLPFTLLQPLGPLTLGYGTTNQLRLAVVVCWIDPCFGSWALLGLFYLLRVTHHESSTHHDRFKLSPTYISFVLCFSQIKVKPSDSLRSTMELIFRLSILIIMIRSTVDAMCTIKNKS